MRGVAAAAGDRRANFRPGNAPGAYLGVIATRCGILTNTNGGSAQQLAQTWHYARDDLDAVKLLTANWYVNGSNNNSETDSAGTGTITAAFSKDLSAFAQVKWSGSASGSMASGATLESDWVPFSLRAGDKFYLREWRNNASGILYINNYTDPAGGDLFKFGASVADQTMGGDFTSTGTTFGYLPLAILGMTKKGSIVLLGDSRWQAISATGSLDNVRFGSGGYKGEAERTFGPYMAFTNLAMPGDRLDLFLASCAKRVDLLKYGSDIPMNWGINDVVNGVTQAQIRDRLNSVLAQVPAGKRCWLSTIAPRTTSSDNWATAGNQTAHANEQVRKDVNTERRAGVVGFAGTFDMAAQVEDAANPGKWDTANARVVTDGAITSGQTAFTSATAAFTAADLYAKIAIPGAAAASALLSTTITQVNSATSVTVFNAAGTTVSDATCVIGGKTADGIHETAYGNLAIAAKGAEWSARMAR